MKQLLFEYSRVYDPVAPIIPIEIHSYDPDHEHTTQTALVDTGADGTMIPTYILHRVGAEFLETRRMRGVTGISQRVRIYLVAIQIGAQLFNGIRAVAMPSGHETILGRDVLNQLVVTLNGLASQTKVEIDA